MVGRYGGRTGGRVWDVGSWLVSLRCGVMVSTRWIVWGVCGVGNIVDGNGCGEGLLER